MLNQVSHPLAGASMTGAEMLVQVLADEGVDTIFGYSGGAILPIYDAVFRYNLEHQASMPLIVPANEQGAGFMAAGYARASGRVGVALVTSGPGAHYNSKDLAESVLISYNPAHYAFDDEGMIKENLYSFVLLMHGYLQKS